MNRRTVVRKLLRSLSPVLLVPFCLALLVAAPAPGNFQISKSPDFQICYPTICAIVSRLILTFMRWRALVI